MNNTRFAALSLAITLLATGGTLVAQQYGPPPPPGYYAQGRGDWDDAPREFHEFGRLGFHAGIDGARKDIENHRRPDVRNRDEFRHPHVPGYAREEYRNAFRHGYDIGIEHILNGGPRPY